MRRRIIAGLFAGSFGVCGVAACTGGPGELPDLRGAYENHPGDYDDPGSTRDVPPGTYDNPPGTNQNPGTQGGGKGTCAPCDKSYQCTVQVDGKQAKGSLKLVTGPNGCQTDDQDPAVLNCDGTITAGGQVVGTWTASGDTLTANVTIVDKGQTHQIVETCKVGEAQPPPPDAGTVVVDAAPPTPAPTPDAG